MPGWLSVQGELLQFIHTVQLLEEKLGVILFQFPPSFGPDRFPLCRPAWPGCRRGALRSEFATIRGTLLKMKLAKILLAEPALARCCANLACVGRRRNTQTCPGASSAPRISFTCWIGQHGAFQHHDQERIDRTAQLHQWWEVLAGRDPDKCSMVFGFFNNDYAGFAAGTANRFKKLTGLPVKPFQLPQQGMLF